MAAELKGTPCQLVVTEASPADGPRLLYILQRWLPVVAHIRREWRFPPGEASCGWRSGGPALTAVPALLLQHHGNRVNRHPTQSPLPPPAAAGPQGSVLSLLSPRPDVPHDCLAQLQFSLKHGVLTLDAIHPPAQMMQAPPPPAAVGW